jgi:hypothetical protein
MEDVQTLLGTQWKSRHYNNIITHLQLFEVTLRRDSGIDPDSALFVTQKARGRHPSETSQRGKGLVCYGSGQKGHKIVSCTNKDKLPSR